MPTYDYACSACGHRFEKFHSMTAEPLRQCPECSEDKLERLIGPGAGIIFKGSGFYQTDYKATRGDKSGNDGNSGDDKSGNDGNSGDGKKSGDSANSTSGNCSPSRSTDAAPKGCKNNKDQD